jgi:hypothetical protein
MDEENHGIEGKIHTSLVATNFLLFGIHSGYRINDPSNLALVLIAKVFIYFILFYFIFLCVSTMFICDFGLLIFTSVYT